MNAKDEQYQGYLQSDDIGYDNSGGKSVTVEIASVSAPGTEKDAAGKLIKNPVVHFKNAKKGFVLGRCNQRIIALLHGKDVRHWPGKSITLTVRFGDWFGEADVPAVRVIPPVGIPLPFGVRKHMGRETPKRKATA